MKFPGHIHAVKELGDGRYLATLRFDDARGDIVFHISAEDYALWGEKLTAQTPIECDVKVDLSGGEYVSVGIKGRS